MRAYRPGLGSTGARQICGLCEPAHKRGRKRDATLRGHRELCGDTRSADRSQRRDSARTPATGQGRTRHRQDDPRPRDRPRHRPGADHLAHQVDHQGAAGALRIRRGGAAARRPARRRAGARHRQLHRAGQAVGGVYGRRSPGIADRRDRQGRHRISQRPAARARSNGILRLRNPADDPGPAPPDRADHLEQRKGIARRLSAPLLLSLHPLSGARDDG